MVYIFKVGEIDADDLNGSIKVLLNIFPEEKENINAFSTMLKESLASGQLTNFKIILLRS